MEILLGQNLKKLRAEKSMTQERLAELLGVTPQSVSRWETGGAYPDITLLPVIAGIFGVSTDTLLGTDTAKNAEKIRALLHEDDKLNHDGKQDESIELLRRGLRDFPADAEMTYRLALSLKNKANSLKTEEERKVLVNEAMTLCERAIELDTSGGQLIFAARELLCMCHIALGDYKTAVNTAESLPSIWTSREVILPKALAKHDAYIQYGHNLVTLCDLVIITLTHLARGKDTTPEQKIELLQKAVMTAEMLIGKDCKFRNMRISVCYRRIAREYCVLKNKDAALENLEKSLYYAKAFEERPERSYYNVFWLAEVEDVKADGKKQWRESEYRRLLNDLADTAFDIIRHDKRYAELREKAEKLDKELPQNG